jgi:uncharacterized protein YceH (UPF0502 family)
MRFALDPVETRVLGCLIEKALTTPAYYPLTLNSLVAACNQKSNRDPVMAVDAKTVTEALDELRYRDQLVWQVSTPGSRAPKYEHGLLKKIEFSVPELSILCELMLRGPQTTGELRNRTARMSGARSLAGIEEALHSLMDWEGESYVTRLPPGAGRREYRYAQLLTGDAVDSALPDRPEDSPEPAVYTPVQDRIAALEQEVASLRADITSLHETMEKFRKQFE